MLEIDRLEDDPFEVDVQAAHLFKHPHLGLEDVYDVYDAWTSEPLFYPATPPAHWLMVAEIGGRVLVVPIAGQRWRPATLSTYWMLRGFSGPRCHVSEGSRCLPR